MKGQVEHVVMWFGAKSLSLEIELNSDHLLFNGCGFQFIFFTGISENPCLKTSNPQTQPISYEVKHDHKNVCFGLKKAGKQKKGKAARLCT